MSDLISKKAAVNPPATVLGRENAILSGTSNRYHVPDFEGTLSIKTVVKGNAIWEAGGRQFTVTENTCLIINDREPYSITIDAAREVTTFCVFFKRGFVEDVFRTLRTPDSAMLDTPSSPTTSELMFLKRLETHEGMLLNLTRNLRKRMLREALSQSALDESLYEIAVAMLHEHRGLMAALSGLPSARPSTRLEIFRRLLRGRDYLLSSLDQTIRLEEAARAACMSPFHFHRTFTAAFGETPHNYLTRHRLERARVLLERDDQSITEIGLECGFESPGSLSTLFRRAYQTSPREFRASRSKK
jgi:AraC-like DNA-binding protein